MPCIHIPQRLVRLEPVATQGCNPDTNHIRDNLTMSPKINDASRKYVAPAGRHPLNCAFEYTEPEVEPQCVGRDDGHHITLFAVPCARVPPSLSSHPASPYHRYR